MTIKRVDYGALIQNTAKKYNVDPELVQSVIQAESGGDPTAASGTGPVGLMQVSRALAKDYGYSEQDRLDPAKNIEMGTRYLAQNLKAFGGDPTKALIGYNQGTGGARQMLSGKQPLAAEAAKYIQNPAFQKFTQGGIPATTQNIANPVKGLEQSKPDDTYSPALLQRDVAQTAPTQAEAQTGAAMPIQPQQAAPVLDQAPAEAPNNWGQAALAAASMLANRKDKSNSSVSSGVGAGRGAAGSRYSTETQRVLQLLNQVGGVPNFGR